MLRLIWSQLRRRPGRALGLGAGLFVAATGFSLLTAAAHTSQLRATGLVHSNVRSAYDILVRPHGSATALEKSRGLVQDNYLSGIFGGITMHQYAQIKAIPGVAVAAPIANLGYFQLTYPIHVDVRPDVNAASTQLYRVRIAYSANGGLETFRDADQYVYLTLDHPIDYTNGTERIGSASYSVCGYGGTPTTPTNPFDLAARGSIACYSAKTPYQHDPSDVDSPPTGYVGATLDIEYPVLLSAIDPAEEDALVGLDGATVTGRSLRASDRPGSVEFSSQGPPTLIPQVPVVLSNRSFTDETADLTIQRLTPPASANVPAQLSGPHAAQWLAGLPGATVSHRTAPVDPDLAKVIPQIQEGSEAANNYWTAGPVHYEMLPGGRLAAKTTTNPSIIWHSTLFGDPSQVDTATPIDDGDTQFRKLTPKVGTNGLGGTSLPDGLTPTPRLKVVGSFDPQRLAGFSPLSAVPLESYTPPVVTGADAASRAALHDQPLRPDRNIGGYLAQPPSLLTTLSSVSAFTNSRVHRDYVNTAPISVIRIRVSGVHGIDALSRARINQVADDIRSRTGLDVDITLGSSPAPQLIQLPATRGGAPALLVREGWTKKGVAVAIVTSVDRASLVLFGLVLIVCLLFAGNATLAAVQHRRTELGVLSCLGWPARRMFALVCGEVAVIGLAAGCVSAALAVPLAAALGVQLSALQIGLIVPGAVVLAVVAAALPATVAARRSPADAVRPPAGQARAHRAAGGLVGLAVAGLIRRPWRNLLAAVALALGVAAFTTVLAITQHFHGQIVGSLLGNAVDIKVRGIDYVAVITTLILSAAAVADVLYLGVRDRAPELAALYATGWSDRALGSLVGYEALGIGVVGSVVGGAAGLAIAATLAGAAITPMLPWGLAAVAAGLIVTLGASVAPAGALRRLPVAELLAADI